MPSPLLTKLTPEGSAPLSESVAEGNPVDVTVKEPEVPVVNVVLESDVMAGAWSTVRVKDCVAFGLTPLSAVIVIGYVPPVPAAGVPASEAVPFPLSVKVTPEGNGPLSESPGVGLPVVVTWKLPPLPVVNVVLGPEVMVGATGAATIVVEPSATGGEYGGVEFAFPVDG